MSRRMLLLLALVSVSSERVSAQVPTEPTAPAAAVAESLAVPADTMLATPPRPRALDLPRANTAGSAASPTPERPDLVDARSESTVREERDRMQQYVTLAEGEAASARSRAIQGKATVDIKKTEIATLDQRIKTAKQAKLDAERKSLEAEKKRQETMRDFFEQRHAVEIARGELSTAQIDYGRAALRACDLELQLIALRAAGVRGDDNAALKLEQQFLESWKVTASAREKVAEREQGLADRKLRVYRAWVQFMGGK